MTIQYCEIPINSDSSNSFPSKAKISHDGAILNDNIIIDISDPTLKIKIGTKLLYKILKTVNLKCRVLVTINQSSSAIKESIEADIVVNNTSGINQLYINIPSEQREVSFSVGAMEKCLTFFN